jgi:hypothetical protein
MSLTMKTKTDGKVPGAIVINTVYTPPKIGIILSVDTLSYTVVWSHDLRTASLGLQYFLNGWAEIIA